MTSRPMFIVFEGMDGAGKSTLARELAQAIDGERLASPLADVRAVRATVDCDFSGLGQQLYYASSVVEISARAERALASGRHMVVDRYWASTVVWDGLRPGSLLLPQLEHVLCNPDITVFVDAPDDVRRERMLRRGALSPHDHVSLERSAELRERYGASLRRRSAGRVVCLDTSEMASTACVDSILAAAGLERQLHAIGVNYDGNSLDRIAP